MIFSMIAIIFALFLDIQVNGSTRRHHSNKTKPESGPIIDGDLAGESEFKYIVAIGLKGSFPQAGGSILDEYWILTARHVLMKGKQKPNSFEFNLTVRENFLVWPKYYNDIRLTIAKLLPLHEPAKTFCHEIPESSDIVYQSDSDIALIKLRVPINLGQTIYNFKKIDLYPRDIYDDFSHAFDVRIAGWGKTSLNQGVPTWQLRKSKMNNGDREADHNHCSEPRFKPRQQIPLRFRKNSCYGDSGGPAVLQTIGTGQEELIGVISYMSRPVCYDMTLVQNTAYFRNWIEEVMRSEPDKYLCSRLNNTVYNRGRHMNKNLKKTKKSAHQSQAQKLSEDLLINQNN
ncbi:mite allergen Der p 3-like [Brevipalpus obovatus]|uniref:mite allergen Der p 3-like n=1 Tax=Brevipalpus obovatus TaxID=246614 RepID=UPI003D9E10DD